MEVGANRTDDSKKASGNALEALDYYRSAVSVPTVSTKWFFPSDYDLITLHDVVTTVNTSIGNTNGTQLVINDGDTMNGCGGTQWVVVTILIVQVEVDRLRQNVMMEVTLAISA